MLKKILFPLLMTLVILNLSVLPVSSAAEIKTAETKTVVLDVPGMTCKFCPITIKKALKKVDGVVEAKADYDSKTATVTFDPAKTTVDELTKATANAGYPSTLKQ